MTTVADYKRARFQLADEIRTLVQSYADRVGPHDCGIHGNDADLCDDDCTLVFEPGIVIGAATVAEWECGNEEESYVDAYLPKGQSIGSSHGLAHILLTRQL